MSQLDHLGLFAPGVSENVTWGYYRFIVCPRTSSEPKTQEEINNHIKSCEECQADMARYNKSVNKPDKSTDDWWCEFIADATHWDD